MREATVPMATTRVITDEELMRLPKDGNKYELVDGEIRVSPAGARHGQICLRLGARLLAFVAERRLGAVFDSSTGFRMPKGNVRAPDASFVAAGRLPGGHVPKGFFEIPPDLAAEVLSPSDSPRSVLDGVGEYLESGVRLVWVVDPEKRRAVVYRSLTETRDLDEGGVLDGEDVLPGFRYALTGLLE